MAFLDVFNERILLPEVGIGLVDDIAIFDGDDVVGEFDEAEFPAVIVDMELFALFDVDVVEESEFAHCGSIHLRVGLDRLHPQSKFRHLLRLYFVLVEVEIQWVLYCLWNEVELEIRPIVKYVHVTFLNLQLLICETQPMEFDFALPDHKHS